MLLGDAQLDCELIPLESPLITDGCGLKATAAHVCPHCFARQLAGGGNWSAACLEIRSGSSRRL